MSPLSNYIDQLNSEFLQLFTKKENSFWESKMGLSDDPAASQERTADAEIAVNTFSQDASKLKYLRDLVASTSPTPDDLAAAKGWEQFFTANAIEEEAAQKLSAEIVELEGKLLVARGGMELGYTDPKSGEFKRATTNELSNLKRISDDEATRKAAYDAMKAIGPFALANGFLEIIKKRNELGKSCGYEDYYDWKVQRTEGFSKRKLFELLDDLEVRTRESAQKAIAKITKDHGQAAARGWNFEHFRSGSIAKELDPYLPFSLGLERWVRSFAALGIKFRGAQLTLDLIDRIGKYENGFMHGPQPAWYDRGKWNSARINFTANAIPNKVGSGHDALNTLFHEGGHAAHFSNIQMNAPCFAQEFAPTSVAYAETQSMFCDAILSDSDWLTRYAKDVSGNTIPFAIIERQIELMQPYEVINVRAMLGVCYFEKAIYELPVSELTAERIIAIADEVERRMYFMPEAPRPILAVPHILAGESSAYYHGYVLAEMAVHQTRKYILEKYGYINDNPNVGPELERGYWKSGNSVSFMELVKNTTGKAFSADALVEKVSTSVEDEIQNAKAKVATLSEHKPYDGPLDLDAKVKVVHGNELICEFNNDAEFPAADAKFREWVLSHYPKS